MPDATGPLSDKVALITGGSRGIGAAISIKLAAWGCTLFVNYVERDAPASELADRLKADGTDVTLLKGDVGDPDDVARIFDTIEAAGKGLDILVHNAASTVFRSFQEVSLREWDYTYNTNVRSHLLIAQRARPLMANRGARFFTLSNNSAVRHVPRNGVFGSAKAAIESLTRSLSVELAADGIVVNCIRPGTVATGVTKLRPDFLEAMKIEKQRNPWKRTTTSEDVADVVALFCMPEAAWICGQTIVVDGGWSGCSGGRYAG